MTYWNTVWLYACSPRRAPRQPQPAKLIDLVSEFALYVHTFSFLFRSRIYLWIYSYISMVSVTDQRLICLSHDGKLHDMPLIYSWLASPKSCKRYLLFTRESRMLRASLPLSGRLSVCLSHSWTVSKRCKLGSRNLHYGLPQVFSVSWQNFVPLGAGVPLERGRQRG